MVPFNPMVGEFRVHYAGFFDPGFGYAAEGGGGAKAVLEVRTPQDAVHPGGRPDRRPADL